MSCSAFGSSAMVGVVELDWRQNEERHDKLVLGDGERLGEEVGKVVRPLPPLDDELPLADAIADPVETHVKRLRAFQLDSVGSDTDCTGVVAEDGRGGLSVSECEEDGAEPYSDTSKDE